MVAAPIRNEWLEKFPAGVPDRCRTALRCFWNQKRVAGRLESSVKRGRMGVWTVISLGGGRLGGFGMVIKAIGV